MRLSYKTLRSVQVTVIRCYFRPVANVIVRQKIRKKNETGEKVHFVIDAIRRLAGLYLNAFKPEEDLLFSPYTNGKTVCILYKCISDVAENPKTFGQERGEEVAGSN